MGWKLEDLPPGLRNRVREAMSPPKAKAPPSPPPEEEETQAPVAKAARADRDGDTLTVWLTALGKPRMTQRDKWQKRKPVVKYREFADALRASVPPDMLVGVEGLSWTAWLPMPESWTARKKCGLAGKPHDQKPDRDNIDKALLDSLLPEDKKVSYGTVDKRWDDGKGPRIELTFHYERMKPTREHFREAVEAAKERGLPLLIENYYSSGGRKSADMVVDLLPPSGYDDLIGETLREATPARLEEIVQELVAKFPGTGEGFIRTCVDEQMKAWRKRVEEGPSGKSSVEGGEGLVDSGKGWHSKPSDPFVTVLLGLRRVAETVRYEAPAKEAAAPGKTAIKNAFKNMLPMGDYIGRLNLTDENVDDVRVLLDGVRPQG